LHWADEDAMLLLAHLIRSARPGRIRIITAYRTTEGEQSKPFADLVANLAVDDRVAWVELAPLALDDAIRLAHDRLYEVLEHADKQAQRELLQGLAERTHGIPLFLVHFAKALQEAALERETHAGGGAARGTSISVADLERLPWGIAQHVRL